MRRAIAMARCGDWPAEDAIGAVTLDYESRYRRRVRLDDTGIGPVLLDLPQAVILADGDGLKLNDGHWLQVLSAPEPLLEIRLSDPQHFMSVAWHLGNHHCPADITADRIRVRHDSVIETMLKGQGCAPEPVQAAFNPERGAYHHQLTNHHEER